MSFKEEVENKALDYNTTKKRRQVRRIALFAAELILKKAQERCEDHWQHSEGRIVNHDNPDDAWGEVSSANELLDFIKSYIEGKK